MAEEALAPDVVERVRKQLVQEHPEMEGAEVVVSPRRRRAEEAAVAAKIGLPSAGLLGEPEETHYTVTLRKEVEAEDGVTIPLVVRVTVDAQGEVLKRRETR